MAWEGWETLEAPERSGGSGDRGSETLMQGKQTAEKMKEQGVDLTFRG